VEQLLISRLLEIARHQVVKTAGIALKQTFAA